MVKLLTRISFFLLCFLCTLIVNAQLVEWSNQQKVKSKSSYTRVLGENATGMYLARCKNSDFANDIIIEKYKNNLALENSVELKQPYGSVIEKLLLVADGIVVVASIRNDSLPKVDVFYWKIDASLKSAPSKMLTQIDIALFRNNTLIYAQASTSLAHFSLVYFTSGSEKNTSTMHLLGFNESLQEEYHKRSVFNFPPNENVVSAVEHDNQGNVFILIDFPKIDQRKFRGKNVRDFFVYAYNKSSDKLLEYPIANDTFLINDIGITVNNVSGLLNVMGTFSTDNDSRVTGTFLYTIETSEGLVRTAVFEPIAKSFVQRITNTLLNETNGVLTDLYIRKIIPRSDGGCLLVLEKFYETKQIYTYYANGFPQTASRTTYNYDEIIFISKDATGKTQYQDFIKKSQATTNDGGYFSSFVTLNSNNKLSFVYSNDVAGDGDIMISTINPLGQMDTKILIKSMSYYVMLMPLESKQISANSVVVCTMKDRRFTLMKLTQ